MEVWRINLREKSLTKSPLPASWRKLGGRGLTARILLDEVPPTCDPLGPSNKLILAPGLLVGHGLSSCDRLSAGAKSPLTGGIKESNAGGKTGSVMSAMGIRALILEDQPAEGWWVLRLTPEGVEFLPADKFNDEENSQRLFMNGVYASARLLTKDCSPRASILLIGPGGEMGLRAAGLCNTDPDGRPTRINARGGLGAVMGSKRVKAIIFEPGPRRQLQVESKQEINAGRKDLVKIINNHPLMAGFRMFGTAGIASLTNELGAMPTRNYQEGRFEEIDQINGEALRELLASRGGASQTGHQCMAGCAIRCSNVFGSKEGVEIVGPLEFETIGLIGSNLGIGSLEDIARLNHVINDLGLDTIEIGAALGVAAEAGIMPFGDADKAMGIIREIGEGTPLGRVIGNGAATTAKVFNIRRVTTVKGQAISAYDPRAIKGTGVTYATSPQGGDHTAGLTIRAKVDHLDPDGQVDLSRRIQINVGGYDTLGACLFSGYVFAENPEIASVLLNSIYGWQTDKDILLELGRETLSLEREFNRLAGFTEADDRLPEWMTQEENPSTGTVFDVPDEELDTLFNWQTDGK